MQTILGDYLRDRAITYPGRHRETLRGEIHRGFQQKSILELLLWNLGYNWVLRIVLLRGLRVMFYVDDTLLLVWERK